MFRNTNLAGNFRSFLARSLTVHVERNRARYRRYHIVVGGLAGEDRMQMLAA